MPRFLHPALRSRPSARSTEIPRSEAAAEGRRGTWPCSTHEILDGPVGSKSRRAGTACSTSPFPRHKKRWRTRRRRWRSRSSRAAVDVQVDARCGRPGAESRPGDQARDRRRSPAAVDDRIGDVLRTSPAWKCCGRVEAWPPGTKLTLLKPLSAADRRWPAAGPLACRAGANGGRPSAASQTTVCLPFR